MNRYLLDTQAFLWFLAGSPELGKQSRSVISDPSNPIYVSAASIWEATIKKSSGKLVSPDDLDSYITIMGAIELPISAYHGKQAALLPSHHKDPFDRVIIAQAQAEGLIIITSDKTFPKYNVRIINARS